MKRTKPKSSEKPTAILTADWHLSETKPVCRMDEDWWMTMRRKLEQIQQLQYVHDCPVHHAGDLFDHWKPSPQLLSFAMKYLPKDFYTALGNHDLPQHNLDLFYKTGIATLEESEHIKLKEPYGFDWFRIDWGKEFTNNKGCMIAHIMTYKGKSPWPNCTDPSAKELLKMAPKARLIVTGHNHTPFTEKDGERLLVNPGSIFRLTADQIDHRPRVYLWYSESNTVEPVYLPIEDGMVSREHIELKKAKDERIQKFIDNLNSNWKPDISFEENLRRAFKENKTATRIQEIIYEAMEEERA